MTVGERIKKIRTKLGMSQVDFADKINVSKQTLYKYENDIITNIPSDKIEAAAKLGHVSPAYLMGWIDTPDDSQPTYENSTSYLFSKFSNLMPISKHKIPLLGEIACGEPIFADEDRESYVEAGTDIQADFCLRAKGDSMIGARIMDGDIVFVRKQDIVENGEIAVVVIADEATLKRVYYYPEQGKLLLMPENPAYEPFIYVGEELNEIRILGKAIAFQSDIK